VNDQTSQVDDQDAVVITDDMFAPSTPPPRAVVPLTGRTPAVDPATGRRDFERGMSYWPAFTLALIAANLAAFVWEFLGGALADEASIVAAGARCTGRACWKASGGDS
jgi:hypothetical protein